MFTTLTGSRCGFLCRRWKAWRSALFSSFLPLSCIRPTRRIRWIPWRRFAMAEELTLSAAGLVKRFPQGDRDVEILHGIDLDLREGEIVAIIGPSGAGKSTLLHLLGLMEQPTAGTLKIQGEEVQSLAPKDRARLRNEYIGFLFQFHHLLPELTVLENVMLPQRIQGVSEHQAAAQAAMLLDTIGL